MFLHIYSDRLTHLQEIYNRKWLFLSAGAYMAKVENQNEWAIKAKNILKAELKRKGIDAYLPIQKKVRMYGNRRRTVEMPLFNCYIFV